MITKIRCWENFAQSLRIHITARYLFYDAQRKFRTKHNCQGVRSSQNELKICMLSPYSEAQFLGRICNFLMKSPNFGTPYCIVYSVYYTVYSIHYSVILQTKDGITSVYSVKCIVHNINTIHYKYIIYIMNFHFMS